MGDDAGMNFFAATFGLVVFGIGVVKLLVFRLGAFQILQGLNGLLGLHRRMRERFERFGNEGVTDPRSH